MGSRSDTLALVVGLVSAFFLQVAIAPNLAIAGIVAETTLCFIAVAALRFPQPTIMVSAFLLGALIDLSTGSPLGVRALAYCLVASAVGPLASMTLASSPLTRLATIAALLFIGELVIAILLSVLGYGTDLLPALTGRVLPSALYDSVVALLFLPYAGSDNGQAGGLRRQRFGGTLKEKLPPL